MVSNVSGKQEDILFSWENVDLLYYLAEPINLNIIQALLYWISAWLINLNLMPQKIIKRLTSNIESPFHCVQCPMLISLLLLLLLLHHIFKFSPFESGRDSVGEPIRNKHGKMFLLRYTKKDKEDTGKKRKENGREKNKYSGKNEGEAADCKVLSL